MSLDIICFRIVKCFALVCTLNVHSANIEQSLYIHRDSMMAVDSTYVPYFAYNSTTTFDKVNARILVNTGDSAILTLVNTDSIQHGFSVKGISGISNLIPANDSIIITIGFPNAGAYIYYDHTVSESFRYMGLSGMIVVKNVNQSVRDFYWNIKDHQKEYNDTLSVGGNVNWSAYYPEYFTINGNSNPQINQDTAARIVGNVGDTINIYMVNTGQALHSIHFHGYHSEIIFSSKYPEHVGRLKDTFGVYSMEVVVLQLVPDQVGEYPVHDHNLVAVSGGLIYPNGMFLTMLIQ